MLTLGTRGSPLALAQAYEAKKRLGEALPEWRIGSLGAWKTQVAVHFHQLETPKNSHPVGITKKWYEVLCFFEVDEIG